MGKEFSSRERMIAAFENRESDYVPCSFMIFTALEKKCKDQLEFIEKQLELGLDVKVELPELPFRFHPEVEVKEWQEPAKKEKCSLLHKEYITPAGKLTSIVRKTEDWPYGNHVPLFRLSCSCGQPEHKIEGKCSKEYNQILIEPKLVIRNSSSGKVYFAKEVHAR